MDTGKSNEFIVGKGAAPNSDTAPGGNARSEVDPSEDNTASAELQALARVRATVEYALAGGVGVGTLGRPVSIERILLRHGFGYLDQGRFVAAAAVIFNRHDLAAIALGSGPRPCNGMIFVDGTARAAARWGAARILYKYLNPGGLADNWIILDPGEGDAEATAFAKELYLPAVELARAYRTLRDGGASEREAVHSLAEVYLEAPGEVAGRIAELELI